MQQGDSLVKELGIIQTSQINYAYNISKFQSKVLSEAFSDRVRASLLFQRFILYTKAAYETFSCFDLRLICV